jgi:hypothetical protein
MLKIFATYTYAEILSLEVVVLEGGYFGKFLDNRWSPNECDLCLYERKHREIPCSFHHMRTHEQKGSYL